MGANEDFELFAEKFNARFGYLPLGKDDPARPPVEDVLCDLGRVFSELLKSKELAATTANTTKVETVTPCIHAFSTKYPSGERVCNDCGSLLYA